MTEGLLTRIGKWLDDKWKAKAIESDMIERTERLDRLIKESRYDVDDYFKGIAANHYKLIQELQDDVKRIADHMNAPSVESKEVADLKTRLEKIELYSGMTRKVDPTKPPVVKSAFQI